MGSFRSAVERIYRRLLALYPGEFRADYGDEMALLVRDRSREEPLVRLLAELVLDTLKTAPKEHFAMWSQDVRYALRMMARSPGFTLVAAGSLALGIGANAAIFSFADALLLRPLPVARPSEVVTVRSDSRGAPLGARSALSRLAPSDKASDCIGGSAPVQGRLVSGVRWLRWHVKQVRASRPPKYSVSRPLSISSMRRASGLVIRASLDQSPGTWQWTQPTPSARLKPTMTSRRRSAGRSPRTSMLS